MRNSVHWGAIFAGVFIGIAAMVFFSLFAIATGISGVNVVAPVATSVSIFGGIYSVIASVASFWLAGYSIVRIANLRDPSHSCLHALAGFGVAAAFVPAIYARALVMSSTALALPPAPEIFITPSLAWTLFFSFTLASMAAAAGGVQASLRSRVAVVDIEERYAA